MIGKNIQLILRYEKEVIMPQTRETGEAARKYGHDMAGKVARYLGTRLLSEKSNEVELSGERLVIKCARKKTVQIGVTLTMLKRIDGIIAALEDKNEKYTLYKVSPQWYRGNMASSRSNSPSASRVMMVSCKAVRKTGRIITKMPSV